MNNEIVKTEKVKNNVLRVERKKYPITKKHIYANKNLVKEIYNFLCEDMGIVETTYYKAKSHNNNERMPTTNEKIFKIDSSNENMEEIHFFSTSDEEGITRKRELSFHNGEIKKGKCRFFIKGEEIKELEELFDAREKFDQYKYNFILQIKEIINKMTIE